MILTAVQSRWMKLIEATRGKGHQVAWVIVGYFAAMLLGRAAFTTLTDHYQLAVEAGKNPSNNHYLFLLHKESIDIHTLKPGDYVSFHSDRLEPYITRDAVITKQVRGLPGDEIRITRDKLYINGLFSGNLNLLTRLQKPSGAYDQTYRVPANHIFVLGSHPRSYDSRYWGVLHVREVFARAKPILF